MKKLVAVCTKLLPGIALLVILILGTYGSEIPKDYDYYKKSGWFLVRPYKYGVYITQPNTGLFYNFSPYDSYYTHEDGTKTKMIEFSRDIKSEESNVIKDTSFRPQILGLSTLSYLNKIEPTATFLDGEKKLIFGSQVEGNSIKFYIQKNEFNQDATLKPVIAISFNEEDFIIDQNKVLLLTKSEEDTSEVNKIFYDTPISTPSAGQPYMLNGVNKIFVFNKIMNGVLGINLGNQNAEIVSLDQDYKTMYLETKENKNNAIIIETFDSLKEAFQNL